VGESRSGKTLAKDVWCERNNHGRSVPITAPVVGGTYALARRIAHRVGVNKSAPMAQLIESIYRAFNKNRILIVDEAHRLLPNDSRIVNPANIELLRDIHDETGCALALISTKRMPEGLKKGAYQYEQLIGRIGMPVLVPTKIKRDDILPIVTQFLREPGEELILKLLEIANAPGRLGILVETLKVASRIAHKVPATDPADDRDGWQRQQDDE
jgi:DNA transposition AAA+ family ATPase